jgi:hypothetical protein
MAMNYDDLDSLRLLARLHHDQRVREADAERLARKIRGTAQPRRRLRLTIARRPVARHRLRARRLET